MKEEHVKTQDKRSKILVVEEEGIIRDFLFQALTLGGYKVALACCCNDGLKVFCRGTYDLVLTDLTVDPMIGWNFVHQMKDNSPNIPICLMTGWNAAIVEPKVNESTVDAVLYKPFSLSALNEKIEQLLISGD